MVRATHGPLAIGVENLHQRSGRLAFGVASALPGRIEFHPKIYLPPTNVSSPPLPPYRRLIPPADFRTPTEWDTSQTPSPCSPSAPSLPPRSANACAPLPAPPSLSLARLSSPPCPRPCGQSADPNSSQAQRQYSQERVAKFNGKKDADVSSPVEAGAEPLRKSLKLGCRAPASRHSPVDDKAKSPPRENSPSA
jgi:hypothetical protein